MYCQTGVVDRHQFLWGKSTSIYTFKTCISRALESDTLEITWVMMVLRVQTPTSLLSSDQFNHVSLYWEWNYLVIYETYTTYAIIILEWFSLHNQDMISWFTSIFTIVGLKKSCWAKVEFIGMNHIGAFLFGNSVEYDPRTADRKGDAVGHMSYVHGMTFGKSWSISHRIHGTGIFTYIYHRNQPITVVENPKRGDKQVQGIYFVYPFSNQSFRFQGPFQKSLSHTMTLGLETHPTCQGCFSADAYIELVVYKKLIFVDFEAVAVALLCFNR